MARPEVNRGATFTALSAAHKHPPTRMSHWRPPEQLVGQPPPLAAGSLVFSPLRKAKGGKLGAQGDLGALSKAGSTPGVPGGVGFRHRPLATVMPGPQTSPRRHALCDP